MEVRLDVRFGRVARLGRVCLRSGRRCPGTGCTENLCLVLYRRGTGACVWGGGGGLMLGISRASF